MPMRSRPRTPSRAPIRRMLMYTCGTTGQPKGALLSHANMLSGARAVAQSLALDAGRSRAVVAAALPHQRAMHRHGRAAGVRRQHRDATSLQRVAMVAARRALSADVAQHGADDHRVPVERRRPHARAGGRLPQRPLRPLGVGAACRPSSTARSKQRFGFSVVEAMGLTECASVAFTNPLDKAARKYGSPGKPLGVKRASSIAKASRSPPACAAKSSCAGRT